MPYKNHEEYLAYQRERAFKVRGTNKIIGYFAVCEQCGEVIKRPLCHFNPERQKYIFCSKKCMYAFRHGREPWNKGMITRPISERPYREPRWGAEYAEWHNECLRRDWYHCQICGSKERLEVHHIKSYKDYPQERLNLDNGITLCKKCHLGVHNFNVLDQQ